jgi:tetratricopeptide (TPR) repeat protein
MFRFKQCLRLDKDHFASCLHLATILVHQKETAKAAKYFKHALKIDPNSIVANYGLGKTVHALTSNVDAPIKYYKLVIEKDPNHFKSYC